MEDKYEQLKKDMIIRLNNQKFDDSKIAELTGFDLSEIEECLDQYGYAHDYEIGVFLDRIKEEFFDNRIRAYKLTKMGLIDLSSYIQPGKLLDFYKKLKDESVVIELKE